MLGQCQGFWDYLLENLKICQKRKQNWNSKIKGQIMGTTGECEALECGDENRGP